MNDNDKDDKERTILAMPVESVDQASELLGRLFKIAEPGVVFSAPVSVGDQTIITTSELSVGLGVGFGSGVSAGDEESGPGSGGGGGGGGFSAGRPVAAIIAGPQGVRIEPIVDPTKLGIALFTTLGAIFLAWGQMRRVARG